MAIIISADMRCRYVALSVTALGIAMAGRQQSHANGVALLYSTRAVPRFFSLPEAEALLPEVNRLMRTLREHRDVYQQADAELTGISHRIAIAGGMIPPRDRVEQLRKRKDAATRALKGAVERTQEIGCQLKDIDMGLVDFPTLYRGQEVYLCWKLGESAIGFWHHIEDGYGGRRPIDSDFIANHRGGA